MGWLDLPRCAAPSRGTVLEVGRPNGTSLRPDLEAAGYSVVSCAGPSDESPCPLLVRGVCRLLSDADGILFRLALAVPTHREVLEAYRRVPRAHLPIQIVPAAGVPAGDAWERTFGGFKASTAHAAERRRLVTGEAPGPDRPMPPAAGTGPLR